MLGEAGGGGSGMGGGEVAGGEGLHLGLQLPRGWDLGCRAAAEGNVACMCLFFSVTFPNPIN